MNMINIWGCGKYCRDKPQKAGNHDSIVCAITKSQNKAANKHSAMENFLGTL